MTRVIWLLSAVFIVLVTTAPFEFSADRQIVEMKISRVSLNPFVDSAGPVSPIPFTLNILLFVPFGALGVLSGRCLDQRRARRRAVLAAILGVLLSAAVETAQAFTRYRIPSSADLLANSAGAVAGAVAAYRLRES